MDGPPQPHRRAQRLTAPFLPSIGRMAAARSPRSRVSTPPGLMVPPGSRTVRSSIRRRRWGCSAHRGPRRRGFGLLGPPPGVVLESSVAAFNAAHLRNLEAVEIDFPVAFTYARPDIVELTRGYADGGGGSSSSPTPSWIPAWHTRPTPTSSIGYAAGGSGRRRYPTRSSARSRFCAVSATGNSGAPTASTSTGCPMSTRSCERCRCRGRLPARRRAGGRRGLLLVQRLRGCSSFT